MKKVFETSIRKWVEKDSKDYFAKRYFRSLCETGFPTNTHVYDLNSEYLESRLPREEAKYLLNMKNFYYSLPFLQRLIFVNEYLEKGKYYQYWWLKYGTEKFMQEERRKFKCCLTKQILSLLKDTGKRRS